ncbi:hypothetical protein FE257_000049 [Aspergillus nanangensis]|uniref:Uncharacterized protein n=1 Tax=Aspergillus nanangensis TaxID=2582783 RepID=A0AAD4CZ11_ASPNN|nr:hypothetical protein FE257_000049 [Aspergillus nanangensis]
MSQPAKLFRYILWTLAAIGSYILITIVFRNGLRDEWYLGLETGQLHGSPDGTLLRTITGIGVIDIVSKEFILMAWPATSGNCSALSLVAIQLVATWGISHILVALDARREGTVAGVAWRLAWLGLLESRFSLAITLPVYLATTLSPHRTDARKTAPPFRSIPNLKRCFIIGLYFYVPILALTSPDILSYNTKQILMISMYDWSASVSVMLWALSSQSHTMQYDRPASERRATYLFTLGTAMSCHWGALLFPLLRDVVSLRDVFVPVFPWSVVRFPSIVEATTAFFQWDYIVSATSLLVWAVGLNVQDSHEPVSICRVAIEAFLLSVVTSPAGAAVVFIWRLDESLSRRAKVE